ncbi:cell division protein ZapA [Parasphingopyxis lamellibrachiae]|uniref:Cell division protein ZapA n=1 Tax=Parasphingopyxis lamellibrachiae TaxID=680125 RepID=A0A3D9FC16_9SPHN|nr:cell division protein ZapA [Parasphingopyxis lamellibrachiae]RED15349.1 cell division protein ZapA [Parasphingopyxis lamellibrachiae]
MAEVTLNIAGHSYTVACRDGEEERLEKLGQMVDAKTVDAQNAVGGNLGEARILLFASLLLADEADELRSNRAQAPSNAAVDDLEKLADQLTAIGDKLASDHQLS